MIVRKNANPDEQADETLGKYEREKRGEWESRAAFSSSGGRRRQHFEPTCPFGHGISNPTPYQARRPPLGMRFTLKHNINVAFERHVFHIIIIRSNLLAAGCKIILAICCKISFFS